MHNFYGVFRYDKYQLDSISYIFKKMKSEL
jgi:hypothetical protein